jgi:pilus assembly protein Flp/PilA
MWETSTHSHGAQRRVDDQRSTVLSATIFKLISRIQLRREDGQSMTEYGVLLALIAVVVIVALLVLGPKIADVFNNVSSNL